MLAAIHAMQGLTYDSKHRQSNETQAKKLSVNRARSVHKLYCLVEKGSAEEAIGCPVVNHIKNDIINGTHSHNRTPMCFSIRVRCVCHRTVVIANATQEDLAVRAPDDPCATAIKSGYAALSQCSLCRVGPGFLQGRS